ncbi:MAG: peptide chain release factor N(5)-glutamine methyltransferase [Acidobacteriota bacterium]
MTIRTALLQGAKLLEEASVTAPRLTAEVLLAHAAGCDRTWLFAHATDELKEVWWIHFGRYLHERTKGKPTQYITGKQEFYGRDFRVTPDVLIPRPETEHLIEAALEVPAESIPAKSILDMGTGSGAIAVTLALELNTPVTACDISAPALRIAAANARTLNAPVHFVHCNWGAPFSSQTFDLIVSNPPYVGRHEQLPIEVRDHEPGAALWADDDGLAAYRQLIPDALRLLRSGGRLILEIGSTQAAAVSAMLSACSAVEIRKDLAGLPRVVIARRP